MSLEEKISKVLFSGIEHNFYELIKNEDFSDACILIRPIISPKEYNLFQEKTQMSFTDFLNRLSQFFKTNPDYVADYDKDTKRWNSSVQSTDTVCAFPGCGSKKTQNDHIIPYYLNKSNLFDFIKDKRINLMPLCGFHNRVKTNSILIGISFMLHTE